MPDPAKNPCADEAQALKEATEKYEDDFEEYVDYLDEDYAFDDEIELTRIARDKKMLTVAIMAAAAASASGTEEGLDPGENKALRIGASSTATGLSAATAATDWFDYEKAIEMAERQQGRLEPKLEKSRDDMYASEQKYIDALNDLNHCEHGQSKELQFDEEGNVADEDDIDMTPGSPEVVSAPGFVIEMGEPTVTGEYDNVKDTKGDYYDQGDDMPEGDADLEDYMPLGDADFDD